MRFMLIIAAVLLHLTSAVTVPKSNVEVIKRATGHKSVFAPGWPKLIREIDDMPANLTHVFTYEIESVPDSDSWLVIKRDCPVLEYKLAKGSPMLDKVQVSLVRPARKVGDPPFPHSTGVVHGEREGDQVLTEYDVVGPITQPSGVFKPDQDRIGITRLTSESVIPDGEFHVAVEVFSGNSSRTTGVAAFKDTTDSNQETWISPCFRVESIL